MLGAIYFLLQRLTQTPDGYSAVVWQVDSSMYILADFSDHDPRVGAQPKSARPQRNAARYPRPSTMSSDPGSSRVRRVSKACSGTTRTATAPEIRTSARWNKQCRAEILPSGSQAPGPIRKTPPPVPGWPAQAG